jgi:putative OPT family oligopeptide transporter
MAHDVRKPATDAAPVDYKPFVPQHVEMREFTIGTVALGLVMTVVLGAANAYLGLKAGQTIAATYPAAVISMAWLRLRRGTILQENLARTAGSIGESVAAGAVFTLPAFLIAGAWSSFEGPGAYWRSTVLMIIGSVLGVLFVSLVRRAMVEDKTLPFPESTAAAEIHKAGQRGAGAARHLFINMITGAVIILASTLNLFAFAKDFFVHIGRLGMSKVKLGAAATSNALSTGGVTKLSTPDVSPAYIGVGYILGPSVASLNFAGSLFAWGFMVPLLIYFLGPQLVTFLPADAPMETWDGLATSVWRFIVRPIAVGGMLVGAAFTMFRMREKIGAGLARAVRELSSKDAGAAKKIRTDRYMSSKSVFILIGITFIAMAALYVSFAGAKAGLTAAVVMLIAGFFFCVVSGYLVGMIGSTNNPISGITLSTLIVAALLMVALGVSGQSGVVAVLGVAAVVCVAAAVAGELLQDFKVGYILGGTPRTIQLVELVAVVVAALAMYFPLLILYKANIAGGGTGFGDPHLSAPQASLMAFLAKGIVGGEMAWPIVGIFFGLTMILLQVRSPMLVAVGMYLPFGTTSAIFVGGMIRWLADTIAAKKGFNEPQMARFGNVGVLIASGLIAGEALMGLVISGFAIADVQLGTLFQGGEGQENYFNHPTYWISLLVIGFIAWLLVKVPLNNAGDPNEPAPPAAMM